MSLDPWIRKWLQRCWVIFLLIYIYPRPEMYKNRNFQPQCMKYWLWNKCKPLGRESLKCSMAMVITKEHSFSNTNRGSPNSNVLVSLVFSSRSKRGQFVLRYLSSCRSRRVFLVSTTSRRSLKNYCWLSKQYAIATSSIL